MAIVFLYGLSLLDPQWESHDLEVELTESSGWELI